MNWPTFVGLLLVTGGATLLGSLPIFLHKHFKDSHWRWWESFCGGVMISASVFSLILPAIKMSQRLWPLMLGALSGVAFIFLLMRLVKTLVEGHQHQRAFLFVFAMGLHNIPEGLAVGVDVAALGWRAALPLAVAIFIQNLPEGLASSMSFLVAGHTLSRAFFANGVTALIETLSALFGYHFASESIVSLPILLAFAGACMVSVVLREFWFKLRGGEAATISYQGLGFGLVLCGLLEFLL